MPFPTLLEFYIGDKCTYQCTTGIPFFKQYSAQYSFQANDCKAEYRSRNKCQHRGDDQSLERNWATRGSNKQRKIVNIVHNVMFKVALLITPV